eukprot:gene13594-15760_t
MAFAAKADHSGRRALDRRKLIITGASLAGLAAAGASADAQDATNTLPPPGGPKYSNTEKAPSFEKDEIVHAASDFLGVTAEAAGSAIERIFAENGSPTGYIAGEETAGAVTVGLRYGKGLLYMKNKPTQRVFWQGPSIGFDLRIN